MPDHVNPDNPCPSCDYGLSGPNHVCYTYEEWYENQARSKAAREAQAALRIDDPVRDALVRKLDAVRKLGDAWVGFDDSHYFGDAVLKAIAPIPDEDGEW